MKSASNFRMMLLPLLLGTVPVFALPQAQQQSAAPAASADQNAPEPETKKHTTADDNPFPEDISKKAAQADNPPDSEKAPVPQPGDSDSSSSRSKFEGIPDMTDSESRVSNGAGGFVLNPKLATEDVRVGGFYLARHDYQGAYARFKEASEVNPENSDAVFGLAEAARGLNHKDEAMQNYRIYLDAFPDEKKSKDARKALAALGAPSAPEK